MVETESWSFQDKLEQYEASMVPSSPTRMGRGSRTFSRGGRGGGRGGRRNSRAGGHEPSVEPESPRGNHVSPDYVLRGAPRGVPRGRGRLWEP
jgi:hypothetical protein